MSGELAISSLDEELAREEQAAEVEEHAAPSDLRGRLDLIIHSRWFQVLVIVLVICDSLIVVAELLLELKVFETEAEAKELACVNGTTEEPHHAKTENPAEPQILAETALHYSSITILSLFILELGIKVFVMRLSFFKHKMEMFDAIVVLLSFGLDVGFQDQGKETIAVHLLILLRLWRVTRIVNGIILSVKTQADKRLAREQRAREYLHKEVIRQRAANVRLNSRIRQFEDIFHGRGLKIPPPDEDSGPIIETSGGGFSVNLNLPVPSHSDPGVDNAGYE